MSFEIFEQEKLDGLENAILENAKAGCKFFAKAKISSRDEEAVKTLFSNAGVSKNDDSIHILDAILATVGKNENDDVFLKEELYKARYTPIDKPVNVDHNAKDIVGHIKAVQLLKYDYSIIPAETPLEEIPEKFHLASSSVIYTEWEDDEEEKRIKEIIEKAEAGEKFVSMECFFGPFDYGVTKASTNENYIINRNKDTSFLTKYLRIYGGKGVYNGYTISRVLRNIKFNGKGIVDNPANKESIIFSDTSPFAHAKTINNVYDILETFNNEETEMPDNNETLITELKTAKASLETKVQELQVKLEEVNQASSKAKVTELEQSLASKTQEVADLTTKIQGLETVKAELNVKFEEVSERAKKAEEQLAAIAQETQKNNRIQKLVDAGLDKEEASAKAEKFASLNDEMFEEIVVLTKGSKKEAKTQNTTVESATAEVIEGSEKPEETVVTGSETDKNEEREKAQASLCDFLSSQLQYHKNNKK